MLPALPLAILILAGACGAALTGLSPWLAIPAALLGFGLGHLLSRAGHHGAPTESPAAMPVQDISPEPAAAINPDVPAAAVIDALDAPLMLLAGRRVVQANNAAVATLGAHIVGQDVLLGIRHPDASALIDAHERDGGVRTGQLLGFGGPGRRWQITLATLAPGYTLVHLHDLSPIDAAERMRTDFVANASHELRTPIAAILGFVETLSEPDAGNDPATRERFLGIMGTEARRMLQLVNDLISLSQIEAARFADPEDRIDIADVARSVASQIEAAHPARAGHISVRHDGTPLIVAADRLQIEQVIQNLVGNALKYGHRDGVVTVSLGQDKSGQARLAISDQGDGIEAEHLPRLTERFYRVDAGRSRASGGTGLGLAIVKNIVERHRGTMTIESTRGKGTTVAILLPPAPHPAG